MLSTKISEIFNFECFVLLIQRCVLMIFLWFEFILNFSDVNPKWFSIFYGRISFDVSANLHKDCNLLNLKTGLLHSITLYLDSHKLSLRQKSSIL